MPHRRAIDWSYQDLLALMKNSEQENLMLDYKASLAIGEWTDTRRNELAKDICAFANSTALMPTCATMPVPFPFIRAMISHTWSPAVNRAASSSIFLRIPPRN